LQTEDLSSLEKTHCIYEAGRDRQGRPVVAFIGKWFPYERTDLVRFITKQNYFQFSEILLRHNKKLLSRIKFSSKGLGMYFWEEIFLNICLIF
jgi:hypothetical protein